MQAHLEKSYMVIVITIVRLILFILKGFYISKESSFHGDYDLKIAVNNSKNANLNFSHLNDLPEAR